MVNGQWSMVNGQWQEEESRHLRYPRRQSPQNPLLTRNEHESYELNELKIAPAYIRTIRMIRVRK